MTTTYAQTLALLKEWEVTHNQIAALIDGVDSVIGIQPEGQFHSTVWSAFNSFTRTLAKLLQCEIAGELESDLHWYWHECRMGKTPMSARQIGIDMRIGSIDDLARFLRKEPTQ